MNEADGTNAIVIGAGIAGLIAARVLSDHVDRVTVLERDRLPDEAVPRRGVPQGRHGHLLLAAGRRLLDGWFPGLTGELAAAGAVPLHGADLVRHQGGGYRARPDLGFLAMSASRPLLEDTVRRCLLRQRRNVTVVDQTAVDGLVVATDRIAGTRVDGVEHRADLVVACTGRNTHFLDQLAELGFPAPEVAAVRVDAAYASQLVRRGPDDLDGALAVVVDDRAGGHRTGTMVPVEGDRWLITIGSRHGEVPPSDPTEFETFARELPSPTIADVLTKAEALSPVLTHRIATDQRRQVERLRRAPAGFLVLGDAICSLNPIHAQGMTSAALQALALDRALRRYGPTSPRLPGAFYRRAGRAVDVLWRTAVGADFADPRTTGRRPVGTGLVNRYRNLVSRACHTSPVVARQALLVQHLLARPVSLATPAMMLRVLLATRRRPGHPTSAGPVAGEHTLRRPARSRVDR
ncbi:2-polyprenyl-6-methoxyphenol hydroxylase-like FAD-dependent oxidoreductase [Micromonospora sp. Llam0]|uniref:NAD(P)/FAD-dependent oxidoreductase n=1 Tax=Micromonospora sp. Llam0 TaxID=2485143 RepID=UPI000F481D14|nr:FAD-dependent monooxygenase [Micromonospora sp. Llam0]ROO52328.1 2-polyprenyl-6-methoxyphenol hydroxylase-like FAD-dependent oxidoreductase [Micromonospora sp. Llam0]